MAKKTRGERVIADWLIQKNWSAADFQRDAMAAWLAGKSGLVTAPTGSGKTYSLFLPLLVEYINTHADYAEHPPGKMQVLWITPLRALTKDLQRNMQKACDELGLPWRVGIRTGDLSAAEKTLQKKQMPEVLLITPESLHLFFTRPGYTESFSELSAIIVDEWHELLGSKRGVQVELGISRLKNLRPNLKIWGMSATVGNIRQAMDVLLGPGHDPGKATLISSRLKKITEVHSVLPDRIEKMPWAGHVGIHLLDKTMPVILNSKSTLMFTNTRSQTEIWYRFIAENYPELAGLVALHHGSLDREIRTWVEENIHAEKLKLVICTSSLDLGVDFLPVETVIQVGSAKSIARFVQRAGRSGHRPGAVSRIYFVPTHALELLEAVSLREAVRRDAMEDRTPVLHAYDVLAQYMVTLALGDGFDEKALYREVTGTHAYQYLTRDEWERLLGFISTGGPSLTAYDDFRKVEPENGRFVVRSRKVARRHRLSMGTIVSDPSLKIVFENGKFLGTIEEGFIARMNPGDQFVFSGMALVFVRLRELTVYVRKGVPGKGLVPRWAGGRMPLSSQLAGFIRERLGKPFEPAPGHPEMKKLAPLLRLQAEQSAIPNENQLLIEQCRSSEGYHIFVYPFAGRLAHEGLAAVIAWRIAQIRPMTFSMAMNDYGFELLSDREVDMAKLLETHDLFSADHLLGDIQHSMNATELARRKFREIAAISGLLFTGYPGQAVKNRHIQASSSLLFEVIGTHEPDNLLIKQAYREALENQLDEMRMRDALRRIHTQEILIRHPALPTPFGFPILVDRLREQLSSEKVEDRVNRLLNEYEQPRANLRKR